MAHRRPEATTSAGEWAPVEFDDRSPVTGLLSKSCADVALLLHLLSRRFRLRDDTLLNEIRFERHVCFPSTAIAAAVSGTLSPREAALG